MMSWHSKLLALVFLIGIASSQGIGVSSFNTMNYELIGEVVNASGMGMPGVTVWVISTNLGTINATEAINTTTNTTGYYVFNVPSGSYTLIAEYPGYSFTSANATVSRSASVAQVITGYAEGTELPPTALLAPVQPAAGNQSVPSQLYTGYIGRGTGWVQGRVVDQGGVPIPMASIRVDGFMTAARSDEEGNYKIALNPGLHRIGADKTGYGIPPRVVPVFAGQNSTLDLIGKGTVALGTGRLRS